MGFIDNVDKFNEKMRKKNAKLLQENGLNWKIITGTIKTKICNLLKKKEAKEPIEKQ